MQVINGTTYGTNVHFISNSTRWGSLRLAPNKDILLVYLLDGANCCLTHSSCDEVNQ